MVDTVFSKCSVCKRRLVWIHELDAYIPLTSRDCRHDDCPFVNDVDDLEIDEEINYDPDNFEE